MREKLEMGVMGLICAIFGVSFTEAVWGGAIRASESQSLWGFAPSLFFAAAAGCAILVLTALRNRAPRAILLTAAICVFSAAAWWAFGMQDTGFGGGRILALLAPVALILLIVLKRMGSFERT